MKGLEMKGKFIVLEGLDGAGTTTQAIQAVDYLFNRDKKNHVLITREPTCDSPAGIEIRLRLSGRIVDELNDDPQYISSLFIQDRFWHAKKIIEPTLSKGHQVICDRYDISTIAYQSSMGGDMDELIAQHAGLYLPDLTILLDISSERAMERIEKNRETNPELFERLDFQTKVQANYLLAVEKLHGERKIVVIDGGKSIDEVAKEIQNQLDLLYGYKEIV
jgi:dTMP kinase